MVSALSENTIDRGQDTSQATEKASLQSEQAATELTASLQEKIAEKEEQLAEKEEKIESLTKDVSTMELELHAESHAPIWLKYVVLCSMLIVFCKYKCLEVRKDFLYLSFHPVKQF